MNESNIHAKPLNPHVAFSHDHYDSVYPDSVFIPMDNGHVVTYDIRVTLPEPQTENKQSETDIKVGYCINLIKTMNRNIYGRRKYRRNRNVGERCEHSTD